jgi:hypothetical protein
VIEMKIMSNWQYVLTHDFLAERGTFGRSYDAEIQIRHPGMQQDLGGLVPFYYPGKTSFTRIIIPFVLFSHSLLMNLLFAEVRIMLIVVSVTSQQRVSALIAILIRSSCHDV